jgi:hypothetical protein
MRCGPRCVRGPGILGFCTRPHETYAEGLLRLAVLPAEFDRLVAEGNRVIFNVRTIAKTDLQSGNQSAESRENQAIN